MSKFRQAHTEQQLSLICQISFNHSENLVRGGCFSGKTQQIRLIKEENILKSRA
jgi:hypothetical protein